MGRNNADPISSAELSKQGWRSTMGTQKDKEQISTVTIEDLPSGADVVGGRIEMSAEVVQTIAGMAARETAGIHSLGRSALISFGKTDLTRGVDAEVGSSEAAVDLEVTIEYGVEIRSVVAELRKRIADQVDRMAGRKVIEVNVKVLGIHFPEPEPAVVEKSEPPRVR